MLQNIINDKINKTNINNTSNSTATVLRVDPTNNVADIFIPFYGKQHNGKIFNNTPICIAANGIHQANLKPGDNVYVQFNNSSSFGARIISKADELYADNTFLRERHLEKGSLLPKNNKEIEGREKYNHSYKNWLNNDNSKEFISLDFKDKEPIIDIAKFEESLGSFSGEEVGLYNPVSSSIVKVKDNGDIEIFATNNIGVRINSRESTVELFGDIDIKGSVSINGKQI